MTFPRFLEPIAGWLVSHPWLLRGLALSSGALFILTPLLVPIILIRLPDDSLLENSVRRRVEPKVSWVFWIFWHVLKNILGSVLLLLGILLLFLPGQGILTILAGLFLLDIPGRKTMLRRLLSRPKVEKAVNSYRKRHGRKPFLFETKEG